MEQFLMGAIAMTGGSYQGAMFCVSWPTGEFGGMGLEGSVKLGYRNELAAIEDPVARKAKFDEKGNVVNGAVKLTLRFSLSICTSSTSYSVPSSRRRRNRMV